MPPSDFPLCPRYHTAVELIGRRWNGAILFTLLHGPYRFNELRAQVPDLSDKMLSERLRGLEAEGLVTRTVRPETPVRVEYALTDKGRALRPVLDSILAWSHAWLPDTDTPPA